MSQVNKVCTPRFKSKANKHTSKFVRRDKADSSKLKPRPKNQIRPSPREKSETEQKPRTKNQIRPSPKKKPEPEQKANPEPKKANDKTKTTTETPKEEANKISIYQLKRLCKQYGVKGYSKKKKSDLVKMLLDNVDESNEEVRRACHLSKTVKELKAICKKLKIKGYSKQRKIDLVNIINNKEKHNKELTDKINKYFDEKTIIDDVSIKTIIKEAYMYQKPNKKIKIIGIIDFYIKNIDKIKHAFVKTLVKKYITNRKREQPAGAT